MGIISSFSIFSSQRNMVEVRSSSVTADIIKSTGKYDKFKLIAWQLPG